VKGVCELGGADITRICDTFLVFEETKGLLDEIVGEKLSREDAKARREGTRR